MRPTFALAIVVLVAGPACAQSLPTNILMQIGTATRIIVGGSVCGFRVDENAIDNYLMTYGINLEFANHVRWHEREVADFREDFEQHMSTRCQNLLRDHGPGGRFNPVAVYKID